MAAMVVRSAGSLTGLPGWRRWSKCQAAQAGPALYAFILGFPHDAASPEAAIPGGFELLGS